MSNLRSKVMDITNTLHAGMPIEDTAIETVCQAWREDDILRRQVRLLNK